MINYKYTAMSLDGVKVEGVISAVDEYNAIDRIKAKYPVIVKLDEIKDTPMNRLMNMEIGAKYDPKSLSVMCSQFAIILDSGVPIGDCLSMVASQTNDKRLKRMLESSAEDVSQGTSVSAAFEKNYKGLPVTFIETLKAGEQSGTLGDSFRSLQEYYENSYSFSQKVKSAMSYPMFVMGVGIIVLIVVMAFVMPKFTAMFEDLGGDIPGLTKVLISITDFFQKWWLVIIMILVFGFIGFKFYTKSEKGAMKWAEIQLKLPILGNLNVLQASTEFASTMSTLLKAGLTVSDALNVTSKVINNAKISDDVHRMVEKVETGQDLGKLIKQNEHFPQVLKEMTAVGEKTGELEKTLDTISHYYASEYSYAVTKAIGKLEPTLLIFLAIFAGFIVLALYLPMFTMYDLM